MSTTKKDTIFYSNARRKFAKLKKFYLHLTLYLIASALIIWNLVIIEDTPYTSNILALNYSILVIWGAIIIVHAWVTFKGRIIFNKKWEDEKIMGYMKNETTTKWE